MPVARTLNHDFFKVWSAEMAYVLGYFAADGTMLKNKRGGYYIEFTSTDRILLENLAKVTHSTHTISVRAQRRSGWKAQYRIQVGSKVWFKDLENLGFTPQKSHTLYLPDIPEQYFGDFVRGYFDGDGCAYFKKLKCADRRNPRYLLVTLFTSGSLDFLSNLCGVLHKNGIMGGSLTRKKRGYELKFSHRDSLALYRIMYNTGETSLFLFLPRKREKLEEAIQVLKLDKNMRL